MMYSTEYMDELDAFLDAIEDAGFEYFIGAAFRECQLPDASVQLQGEPDRLRWGCPPTISTPKYQEAVERPRR